MIIPMKYVTLLCLESDKLHTLEQLRALSLMQLVSANGRKDAGDIDALHAQIQRFDRVYGVIQSAAPLKNPIPVNLSPEQALDRAAELTDKKDAARKKLESVRRDADALRPWGDFNPEDLDALRKNGIYAVLCATQVSIYETRRKNGEFPDNVTVSEISRDKTGVRYVVFAREPVKMADAVTLPRGPLHALDAEAETLAEEIRGYDTEISSFRLLLKALEAVKDELDKKLEFAEARDGMSKDGAIAWLSGYVPVTELEKFRNAAEENGWALLIEEPSADDERVPTYIRKPKFLDILDPLFDFIGITPGYRENDVNIFFLLFFPIFFGMILGDAGYGLLFILTAIVCKGIFRKKESLRLPLNLFLMLSCYSLAWGWLSGSWLGIPRDCLPPFMQGWNLLADPANSPLARKIAAGVGMLNDGMTETQSAAILASLKDKFVQYFCFLLAALQLASARVFRFTEDIGQTWRAFGHIGWALMIVANFMMAVNLIVFPGTFPEWGYALYGGGFLLIVITLKAADALNLPFSLIGSFVDVLSYIRLFAVGLSGAYIAVNFNKMGHMLMTSLPDQLVIVGFLLLVAVALCGHILNIALGFLGVMVHAIRLNTLEFSNHMEMQWAGIKFRPFSNTTKK